MPKRDGTPNARDVRRGYMLGMNGARVALRTGQGQVRFPYGTLAESATLRRQVVGNVVEAALDDYASRHGEQLDWDQACITVAFATAQAIAKVWSDDVERGL